MTREQAETIHTGSYVRSAGVLCQVLSVRSRDLTFRLAAVEDVPENRSGEVNGLTSYKICSFIDPADYPPNK